MSYFYYTDDGSTFVKKIDAVKYKLKTKKPVYFYYHDEVFSKINWTIEPPDTLPTLYKMQAQKIRDEYDYVILMYSGGWDSSNILETFFYNNIKLDKIVVAGPFGQDRTSNIDENHNGEIYKNAFPTLNRMGLDSITQSLDYSDLYSSPKNFSIYEQGTEWAENIGARFSPHHWFWTDLEKYVVPKEHENKKIAIIRGTDKPILEYLPGSEKAYGFGFRDTVLHSYGRQNLNFRNNVTNVNFYWDPEFPLLLQKQVNLLKNYPEFVGNSVEVITKTIYNLRHPLIFKSFKSPTALMGKRDKFILDNKNSDLYKFYMDGLNRLSFNLNTSSLGVNYDLDESKELMGKPILSKLYKVF